MQSAKNSFASLDSVASVRSTKAALAQTGSNQQSSLFSSGQKTYLKTRAAAATSKQQGIVLEAEKMSLSGYSKRSSSFGSGGSLIELSKINGTATTQFSGASGNYDVILGYIDENDGKSTLTVNVGGSAIASIQANQNLGTKVAEPRSLVSKVVAKNIKISNGQLISIQGTKNKGELARIDYLKLLPVGSVNPVNPTDPVKPTNPVNPPVTPAKPSTNRFSDNFSGNWMSRWEVTGRGNWGEQNMQVVADKTGKFDSVLRVNYPSGSASPSASRKDKTPIGGTQFYADLNMPSQTASHLSYYVKFSDNFDFVKGGKLPGLYGGEGNNGGRIPDGTDGFSTRFMWRRQGQGEVYAYVPSSKDHGTSLGRGAWTFKPGVWHHIEQEVVLNQLGKNNGRVQVWLDGSSVFKQDGLTFRTVDSLKIDGLFFSTFFGGDDKSWSTPKDVSVDFANFSVSPVTT